MRETIFVWDSFNDCVMSELDGSGAVQVTYTNEPQQYGGVISQRRGTTTSTYHADALGSTRALTDNSGNVTDTYLYDAWGNVITSSGTTVNPFQWVGRCGYYADTLTRLIYVRARMYGPVTGRWLSIDPAGFIDGANLFRPYFVPDSTDPSGMKPEQRTLDCAASTCCKPGSCEFFFSMDVDNRKLCMVQNPFEPNPDPKNAPNPPASDICTSSINRTIQPGDHMTLVLRGGTRCELTEANFYNEVGQQVPWPPRGMKGECQQVVNPKLGVRLDPGKPPGTGGCYVFGELIVAVEFKFAIEVSCGCASGRKYDTIEFHEKVEF